MSRYSPAAKFPLEIYGRIMEEVRQWDDKFLEEQTLCRLSRVSKSWRPEALRSLWRKVTINNADPEKGIHTGRHRTISMISVIVAKGYSQHIRVLEIDLDVSRYCEKSKYETEGFPLEDKIINILCTAVNVQELSISNRIDSLESNEMLEFLYRCRFPHLRSLALSPRIVTVWHSWPTGDPLIQFLANHSGITEVSLHAMDEYPIDLTGNHPRILLNLKKYEGRPKDAKLLKGSATLQDVKLLVCPMDEEDYEGAHEKLIRDLKLIDGPFPSVHRLEFTADCGPYLDKDLLSEINRCFPNLRHLEGLAISPELVKFIRSSNGSPNIKSPLPRLESLLFTANEEERLHDDDNEVEEAMEKLPRLFSNLQSACRFTDYLWGRTKEPPDHLFLSFDDRGYVQTKVKKPFHVPEESIPV
ncbi:hypothetical protein SISNIDRAFT_484251 [Sistotremastrum niveocremeum HHB9708]|uniref:F-box domain-containing protein n=1 Tax=Sistotremastrum niveocremeum HHB9708 TaxID=1314777 RepID=A0A164W3N4_9AGAM|nr:hypothetical protein SISNIDRAFT_484251 [Sistotremastrum niveocremeum HHB9708]